MATLFRKPEYFWPALWGALSVMIAGVLVLEVVFGDVDAGNAPRVPAKVVEARLLPPFTLPPEALQGTESASRPLFVPGRRPAPPALVADAPVMKKGQFVLQGTTVVGTQAMAFLKEVATGKIHRVQKGSKVQDLTLAEVSPNQVVLSLGSDSETVQLLASKGSGAPSTAGAGPFPGSAASQAAPPAGAPFAMPASPTAAPPKQAATPPNPAAAQPPAPSASPAPTGQDLISRRRAARRAQPTN